MKWFVQLDIQIIVDIVVIIIVNKKSMMMSLIARSAEK